MSYKSIVGPMERARGIKQTITYSNGLTMLIHAHDVSSVADAQLVSVGVFDDYMRPLPAAETLEGPDAWLGGLMAQIRHESSDKDGPFFNGVPRDTVRWLHVEILDHIQRPLLDKLADWIVNKSEGVISAIG